MSAVDFEEWVAPPLILTLEGHTYEISAPSVDDAKKVIAAAVRGELRLGIVTGEIPAALEEVLARIGPDEHPALGQAVFDQMVKNGHSKITIDRAAYYAVFYWAKGREYADNLARWMWSDLEEADVAGPKEPRRSRRKTG